MQKSQHHLYCDYIDTMATRFDKLFTEIAAVHNVELGEEFEIVVCKALRVILPRRFGICRGYAITADGHLAGDDIIIYDPDRFPTLRLLDTDDFSRKEHIPIEAIYAYIEAKHSLHIDTAIEDGQSLQKASSQVAAVKALPRLAVEWEELFPNSALPLLRLPKTAIPRGWPHIQNPIYGAIFAKNIRPKKGANCYGSPKDVCSALSDKPLVLQRPDSAPDLIVAGNSVILVPVEKNGTQIFSPFFIKDLCVLQCYVAEQLAFAIGVCSLLYALDAIRLGRMPWPYIIADGLGLQVAAAGQKA